MALLSIPFLRQTYTLFSFTLSLFYRGFALLGKTRRKKDTSRRQRAGLRGIICVLIFNGRAKCILGG